MRNMMPIPDVRDSCAGKIAFSLRRLSRRKRSAGQEELRAHTAISKLCSKLLIAATNSTAYLPRFPETISLPAFL